MTLPLAVKQLELTVGLHKHRAVNQLNVLHIISWCLLSLGAEPCWDGCHHSVQAPGFDAPFVCRGNGACLCQEWCHRVTSYLTAL